MIARRRFVQGLAGAALAGPVRAEAAPLADVLARPAAPTRLSAKPFMVRITRAGDRLVAVGERGLVLLSDDDGHSWRQAAVPVSVSLTGLQFIDAKRGWAIGHSALVLTTRDGGEHWEHQFDGRSLPEGLANPLLDIHFADERQGWAVGAYGLALHTRDGGASWTRLGAPLPNPKGLHLYALARQGERLYIAGEQGLAITLNADGSTESAATLATPYRGSFFSLTALPDGTLLFGGLRGTLLARNTAGEFRALDSGSRQGIVSATLLDAARQRLALVDQSGRVMVGDLSGGRFIARPSDTERRWVAVCAARDGALVGAGTTGVGRLAG